MTTPNTAELVAIYQYIKAHPEEWLQRFWATRTSCGTAYCVAGHAVARAGGQVVFEGSDTARYAVMPDSERVHVQSMATDLLGLTEGQGESLFASQNTIDDIREIIYEITGADPDLPPIEPPVRNWHTNVATIVASLRSTADALDKLGNQPIVMASLDITIQAIAAPHSPDTDEQRAATLDLMAEAVDRADAMEYGTNGLYGGKYGKRIRDGVDLTLFGQMAPPAPIFAELWDQAHTEAVIVDAHIEALAIEADGRDVDAPIPFVPVDPAPVIAVIPGGEPVDGRPLSPSMIKALREAIEIGSDAARAWVLVYVHPAVREGLQGRGLVAMDRRADGRWALLPAGYEKRTELLASVTA